MAGAAFVLTGGSSRRMGRDKALLAYRGGTLVEWVAGEAQKAAGRVALVGGGERYGHLGLRCVEERFAGCGPLSGIEAALSAGEAEWNLVLACDMPGLDAGLLRGLLEAADGCDADVVAAQDGVGGAAEPLCAVYHMRILDEVRVELKAGRYAVRGLLSRLRVSLYPVHSKALLKNVNTPEEWSQCLT
ncbi:MAG: molybdenum cofactor guanylyltransferase [Acidobacteria bacterium]|nr:molybdenum cofactor guanylyltransferase [Acidobacteriota bacterium]